MFKLYSKGCEYAIRALAHATAPGSPPRFQAKDVCAKAGIPESFTRKVFQALVQGDFLEASRGPGGGYSLTRPASEITLIDVVRAVDGEDTFDHCILGFPICGGENPCPLHPVWARAKEQFLHHLGLVTLEEVSVSTGEPDQGK